MWSTVIYICMIVSLMDFVVSDYNAVLLQIQAIYNDSLPSTKM